MTTISRSSRKDRPFQDTTPLRTALSSITLSENPPWPMSRSRGTAPIRWTICRAAIGSMHPAISWGEGAMIDGAGAFVDGPEISSPATMPVSGSATYNGEAEGLYATTYGSDQPRRQGETEIGGFYGDLALTADFSARTIGGCVGCGSGILVDGYASDYRIRLGSDTVREQRHVPQPLCHSGKPERAYREFQWSMGRSVLQYPEYRRRSSPRRRHARWSGDNAGRIGGRIRRSLLRSRPVRLHRLPRLLARPGEAITHGRNSYRERSNIFRRSSASHASSSRSRSSIRRSSSGVSSGSGTFTQRRNGDSARPLGPSEAGCSQFARCVSDEALPSVTEGCRRL